MRMPGGMQVGARVRARNGGATGAGRARGARWRSHTFADGTHAITLVGRIDPASAGALRERVRELIARGARQLILDVTAAGAPDRAERLLLAAVLASQAGECRVAVVVPWPSAIRGMLPDEVVLAQTFDEARALLGAGLGARGRRERVPGGPFSREDRHALAVRQSLRWAEQAAAAGDYENALSWLATVEAVEGALPEEWIARRERWARASLGRR